jgi:ABC-2 type transport system ATP-binding protein
MLRIRELYKTYEGTIHALRDVSLDVPAGMFGLLGPNGAGKSTLMRTIATLQEADSGSIASDDVDLLSDKARARELLGYLPQDFGVYPKVSALEMLEHFAVLKGLTRRSQRREVVEALLARVNLWDARKRKLGTFSGGMRQRFGIAQALLGSPREPEAKERVLYLQRHRITTSQGKLELVTDEAPDEAGIDPYNKLIDRIVDDNRKRFD